MNCLNEKKIIDCFLKKKIKHKYHLSRFYDSNLNCVYYEQVVYQKLILEWNDVAFTKLFSQTIFKKSLKKQNNKRLFEKKIYFEITRILFEPLKIFCIGEQKNCVE